MGESELGITGRTRVVALIGDPVEHSRSPVMQNAAFRALGLDWVYIALPVRAEKVGEAVRGLRALGFKGANVTMPHKTTVIPYLDEVAPTALQIGAVNTIVRRGDKLIGENTDGRGFVRALREEIHLDVRGRRVFLFGAGGVARALAFELGAAGVYSLAIANRTTSRAESLAVNVAQATGCKTLVLPWEPKAWAPLLAEADVIVNGTSAGMHGEPDFAADLPWQELKADAAICDAVYEPLQTNLLRTAARYGLRTLDGLALLLYQGVLAFELWTGKPAPIEVMARALRPGGKMLRP